MPTHGQQAQRRVRVEAVVPAPVSKSALSYVTEHLTAKHFDLLMDEGWHEHTWAVTAYVPSEPFRDGRALKAALRMLLESMPDADGKLPQDLWSGEAIARRVLVLANVVGARAERPEGFGAAVGEVA